MLLDLQSLGLAQRESGLWYGDSQSEVSYPAHGHLTCRAVEDHSFWFRHRNRCIVSLVRRFASGGPFLDIGGGNGYVAAELISSGIPCALIEPGVEGALAARARGVDPVICAKLEDIAWPADSISAAGMFDVLEHIEDDLGALRRLYRLIKPGGRLFLTVPAYSGLFSNEDRLAGHFRRYTISSLAHVLAKSGFGVEFSSYIFAPLPPIIFISRTIPSLWQPSSALATDDSASSHLQTGVKARLIDFLLAFEFRATDAGHSLPFGSSCICVAVK